MRVDKLPVDKMPVDKMPSSQQKETYEGGRKMDKRSLLLFFLLTAHSLKRYDIQPNDTRHNDT